MKYLIADLQKGFKRMGDDGSQPIAIVPQGDVNFTFLSEKIFKLKPSKISHMKDGQVPIEEGEATGHFHALVADKKAPYPNDERMGQAFLCQDENLKVQILNRPEINREFMQVSFIGFMKVAGGYATVNHVTSNGVWCKEHDPIIFPKGLYLVSGQTEEFSQELKRLRD